MYSQNEDVNALVDSVESLKISALVNAAKISPLVHGPTIGPKKKDINKETNGTITSSTVRNNQNDENQQPPDQINYNNNNINLNKNSLNISLQQFDAEKCRFRTDVWRDVKSESEECDSSRHLLQLSDCKAISFRLKANSMEKERRAKVSSDLQTKNAEWNGELERRMQKIRIDSAEKQRQTQAKRLERERAVLKVIEEIEAQAQQNEVHSTQREVYMIEHSRKLIERAEFLKRQDEQRLLIEMINACKTLFINLYECYAATIINCEDILTHSGTMPTYKLKRDEYLQRYESIMNTINSKIITNAEVKLFETLCDDLKADQADIDKFTEEIRDMIAQAVVKAKAEIAASTNATAAAAVAAAAVAATADVSVTDGPKALANLAVAVNNTGSADRIGQYNELMQFFEQYRAHIQPLIADANLKKFRFNCQKAMNTPVNSIASLSPEHLQDKFDKITQLLAGQQIYSSDISFSATEHPLGIQYCTMLLAKKFITQGTTVLATSKHPEYVFSTASVFVAIWQLFPDVGKLFLALLYRECPFFVPYFIPQKPNQSTNEYLKLLGYQFPDDIMEKQEQYLNRISGLQRLYSAIMTAKLRRTQAHIPHPHGLENAWIWLSNILMLDPLPEIFPTLILRFMEICGPDMLTAYGKQFVKLIIALQSQYIPKLDQIDSGGPFSRLKGLIESIISENRIEDMKGTLPANFW